MTASNRRATSASAGENGEAQFTIRVKRLQHSFGEGELRKQVLFDNTLEITRGEIVIMTGPSGSGLPQKVYSSTFPAASRKPCLSNRSISHAV